MTPNPKKTEDGMEFDAKAPEAEADPAKAKTDAEAHPASPKLAGDGCADANNPNHQDVHYDVNGTYHKAEWNKIN